METEPIPGSGGDAARTLARCDAKFRIANDSDRAPIRALWEISVFGVMTGSPGRTIFCAARDTDRDRLTSFACSRNR